MLDTTIYVKESVEEEKVDRWPTATDVEVLDPLDEEPDATAL